MTPNQLKLIAAFLDDYSDVLGNKTCNDYFLPNTPENREMMEEYERWNAPDDPDQWNELEVYNDQIETFDRMVVAILAEYCRREAQQLKQQLEE